MPNRRVGYLVAVAVIVAMSLNGLVDGYRASSKAATSGQHIAMWTDLAFGVIGLLIAAMALPVDASANPLLRPLRVCWAAALITSAALARIVWQLETPLPSVVVAAVVSGAIAWVVLRFSRPDPLPPT